MIAPGQNSDSKQSEMSHGVIQGQHLKQSTSS